MPASGGILLLPPGTFNIGTSTLLVDKPITIEGSGGSLIGDGALNPIRAVTTIVSTSPTADAIRVTAIGATLENFAVVNSQGTLPTAGAGINLLAGSQAKLDGVTVFGFWENVRVSGVYWSINQCHLYDPVNDGLIVDNIGSQYYDHADAGVIDSIISMMYRTYNANAAIKWVSGGGARIIGNKINGGNQPGNSPGPNAGKFAYGIDFAPTANTVVDIDIHSNSIANCRVNHIRITQSGSGQVQWFSIHGNQINVGLAGQVAILISAATSGAANNIRHGQVEGNVMTALPGRGIEVNNATAIAIGRQRWNTTTDVLVTIGAAAIGCFVDEQDAAGISAVDILVDSRPYNNNQNLDGRVEHVYQRQVHIDAVSTPASAFTFGLAGADPLILDVSVTGMTTNAAANSFSRKPAILRQRRVATSPYNLGTVTLATLGTDEAAGDATASTVQLVFDVTTANQVTVKVQTSDATQVRFTGVVRVSVAGRPAKVRKPAVTGV